MPISLPPSFWSNLEELSIRSGAFRKSLLPCPASFIKTTYLGICPLSFPAPVIGFLTPRTDAQTGLKGAGTDTSPMDEGKRNPFRERGGSSRPSLRRKPDGCRKVAGRLRAERVGLRERRTV